ncbi:hypothetical protein HA41_08295 [Pantoea conspicua]|uniref:Uncharacterized protein n=1 Tax=Pantoea conspicua TaxID=472705 RepID=A0A1X1BXH9_9GAMM|nr:hypothetical protein HA41_08295 [Pantoea conspicua]
MQRDEKHRINKSSAVSPGLAAKDDRNNEVAFARLTAPALLQSSMPHACGCRLAVREASEVSGQQIKKPLMRGLDKTQQTVC